MKKPLVRITNAFNRGSLIHLAVDLQEIMQFGVRDRVFENAKALSEACRDVGVENMWLWHNVLKDPNRSGIDPSLFRIVAPTRDELKLSKRTLSGFKGSPRLHRELQKRKIDTIVASGIYAIACFGATICDAQKAGYDVVVANDAHDGGYGHKFYYNLRYGAASAADIIRTLQLANDNRGAAIPPRTRQPFQGNPQAPAVR